MTIWYTVFYPSCHGKKGQNHRISKPSMAMTTTNQQNFTPIWFGGNLEGVYLVPPLELRGENSKPPTASAVTFLRRNFRVPGSCALRNCCHCCSVNGISWLAGRWSHVFKGKVLKTAYGKWKGQGIEEWCLMIENWSLRWWCWWLRFDDLYIIDNWWWWWWWW